MGATRSSVGLAARRSSVAVACLSLLAVSASAAADDRFLDIDALLARSATTLECGLSAEATDGDSLLCDGASVRLWGIDAPEIGQVGGDAATEALSAALVGRRTTCRVHRRDSYGRSVASCFADGVDAARTMLDSCLAWGDARSWTAYGDADERRESCRVETRGLWALESSPIDPAEYRLLNPRRDAEDATRSP